MHIDATWISRVRLAVALSTMVACTSASPADPAGRGLAQTYGADAAVEGGTDAASAADAIASDALTDAATDVASDAAPSSDAATDSGCPCGYEDPKECAEAQQKCVQDPHECHEVAEKCECEDECHDH